MHKSVYPDVLLYILYPLYIQNTCTINALYIMKIRLMVIHGNKISLNWDSINEQMVKLHLTLAAIT